MRFLDLRFILAIVAAGVVVWLAFGDFGNRSPGPLAASHFHAAKLRDDASCEECHASGKRSMAQACSECHSDIGGQLESGDGFHGSLEESQALDCGACHPDHHGRDFSVVSALSFRLAGFETRDSFDHGMLEYGLKEAHDSLGCVECHPHADADWLREDEVRFLGATQDCASCHDDVHDGQMKRSCEECHGQERPFEEAPEFAHHENFPLEGGHARHACKDCHPSDSEFAIEELDGRTPLEEWRSCAACHDTPHGDDFLASASRDSGLPVDASCAECHPHTHLEFQTAGEEFTVTQHGALTGFLLDAPHNSLDCVECHAADPAFGADAVSEEVWLSRFPGRAAKDCATCHEDIHRGQFDDSPQARDGCLSCHAVHEFMPPTFGVEAHAALALKLEGRHETLECAECHQTPAAPAGAARQFRGTPASCAECHDDAHRDYFSARADVGLPGDPLDCASCHDAHSFQRRATDRPPSAEWPHGDWTGFALTDAHARAECESCHPRTAEPNAAGRTLGFLEDHLGVLPEGAPRALLRECTACHADVHDGRLLAGSEGLPANRGTTCGRCHGESKFSELLDADFAHGQWTGFDLHGAHAQADCLACHGDGAHLPSPSRVHDGALMTPELKRRLGLVSDRFTAGFEECASCHADVHDGDFDRSGMDLQTERGMGCARCHDEASFRVASTDFDHQHWTGFALTGAHAEQSCVGCHDPRTAAVLMSPGTVLGGAEGAVQRRLGRAVGGDCVSCHADPHVGQFRDVQGKVDCARCHADDGAFELAGFDHDRDTRFALDDDHSKLDCGACHQSSPLPGGGEAVRYRPLGLECASCHGFR